MLPTLSQLTLSPTCTPSSLSPHTPLSNLTPWPPLQLHPHPSGPLSPTAPSPYRLCTLTPLGPPLQLHPHPIAPEHTQQDSSGSYSHLVGVPKALLPASSDQYGDTILDCWWKALKRSEPPQEYVCYICPYCTSTNCAI